MVEQNTFDWGTLEDSADVQIGKILADERLAELSKALGHVLPVDASQPIREMETK